jgi:hypothetical protein
MDVGYVLLIAAGVALLAGWDLARRGLKEVETAANTAKTAAQQVQNAVAGTQQVLASATGPEAAALASANADAAVKVAGVEDAVGEVKSALAGLTGRFAAARVPFALALLLVLAALVALDVVSVDVAANGTGN